MDLLAALAADPTLLPLWAVMIFAAGMYPIGMMFGCSPCCNPCVCASGSTLPETITVTLDGFTDYSKKQLCTLSFSACYGSGGSGTVDAPGHSSPESDPVDDRGPITAVSLTDGGSGYAKLGRTAPTVTVTGTSHSGAGATFDVTLAQSQDSCGLDLWAVSKVTATGGEGYIDGEELTFSVAEGDTQETAAIATIQLARVAPTVTVTGTSGSGSGATFDVTLAQSQGTDGRDRWAVSKVTMTGGTGYETFDTLTFGIAEGDTEEQAASAQLIIGKAQPALTLPGNATGTVSTQPLGDGTYAVSAVTVTSGGSGYTDGEYLFFDKAADDVKVFNATAIARVAYTEPQNATVSVSSSGGSGAVLEPVWALTEAPEWYAPNVKVYRLAGVTVVNGGTGYADYDPISISFPSAADGAQLDFDFLDADIVGPNGEIQQVYIEPTDGGQWRGARTDALESVELGQGGSYYKDDPDAREVFVIGGGVYYREDQNPKTVSVSNGGKYYREDASLPPYVAAVTVNISQGHNTPSDGAGAVITATVEDDPQSPDFGVITGLEIEDGGDGYLAWMWETNDCCGHYLNGQSIVLERFKDSNAAACEAATKDFYGQYNIPFAVDGQYYSVPSYCVYTTQFCGGWTVPFLLGPVWFKEPTNSKLQLYVGYRGEGERPVVKLGPPCYGGLGSGANWLGCHQDWIADEPIESCSQFSFTATPSGKPSISVTSGGQYKPDWRFSGCSENNNGVCQSCNVCCQGDGESPDEIEVEITDEWTTNRPAGLPDFSGTYVAPGTGNYWSFAALQTQSGLDHIGFGVGLYPCHSGLLPIYVAPLRENCETCIKQCRVWFGGINMSWTHNNILNVRRIAPEQLPNDCDDCESTPVCSPSGKTFALSIADPALVWYGNGTHVATATIQ
jgi:hypothetical protein